MANPQKAKGDRAERECAAYLSEHTKYRIARRFGAGQAQDEGDLYGLPAEPGFALQVRDYRDKAAALRIKPPEADQQAAVIGPDAIGITAIRMQGGAFRFVLTQEAFSRLVDRYL